MATVTSASKYFPTAQEGFTTTTSGSTASGATTVGLNSVSGYSNGDVVTLVIEPTSTTAKQFFTGTIDTSGVQVTGVVWTEGTNQTHAAGSTVVDYETATAWALYAKGMQVEHGQDGKHRAITTTSINNSGTLTQTGAASLGSTLAVTGTTTLTGAVGGAGFSTGTISNPYKFRVWRNAATSTGNATFALVPFDTKTYDTGSNVDVVTNKGRFTAPIAGFYQFNARIETTQSTGTNQIQVALYKNGSVLTRGGGGKTDLGICTISDIVQLAANDYVEIFAYGAATLVLSVDQTACYFSGFLVSST